MKKLLICLGMLSNLSFAAQSYIFANILKNNNQTIISCTINNNESIQDVNTCPIAYVSPYGDVDNYRIVTFDNQAIITYEASPGEVVEDCQINNGLLNNCTETTYNGNTNFSPLASYTIHTATK
jgi:hypothetical protein